MTAYAAIMDPVVKGVDYNPLKILNEVFPDDFKTMQPKFTAAVANLSILNLQSVVKMGGM